MIGTADVWPVDEHWHGRRLRVQTDDEVVISLPENRSTGYRWFFQGMEPFMDSAALVGDDYATASPQTVSRSPQTVSRSLQTVSRSPQIASRSHAREARAERLSGTAANAGQPDGLGGSARHLKRSRTQYAAELVVGGTGRRVLRVRFHEPGYVPLFLQHRSAYTADAEPIGQYKLEINVKSRRRGLSLSQRPRPTPTPTIYGLKKQDPRHSASAGNRSV